jgi:hypothetical protein
MDREVLDFPKNRKRIFKYAEDFSEGRTSEARFSYGESVLSSCDIYKS